LIGRMLPVTIPTLIPKLRKVQALKRFVTLLPPELNGLAAPHEIRLAPPPERFGTGGNDAASQVSTLFVYCSSATVAVLMEQQSARLLAELNAQLPYPLAEALRCEQATVQKIAQQLNNLALGPD
jgi:hypothetical protein